ncbi:MAG: enoyl-CoA hydratase-related protein [Myxococcota bacterium]
MIERDYRAIRVAAADGVATVTLNLPERRNALGPTMVNELLYALDDAKDDPEVRVIVVTGAGGTFCSGGDLKQMGGEPTLEHRGDYADLLLRFRDLGKPTISRIEGYAMGGGLGLVASTDFAVASETAVFGTPEIRRGLFPMMIMAVLRRCVPQRQLMSMMLLGEKLDAKTALDYGLLSHVVPEAELDVKVGALAESLASHSPKALEMGLLAFRHQESQTLDEALPYLRDQLFALLGTEDAQEGLRAFMEKRAPVWKGR